tara:strand:- start:9153 stop:10397 length:1245 start_codon:yes stop_codon:yes gene_type:complete
MTLIKTSLLNGIAVAIKMLTLLGLNKILAIYVGPAGYASIGQFQNGVQIITKFASAAVGTGVTKYTAEYRDDTPRLRAIWKTAGTMSLIGTVIIATTLIVFSKVLAIWFLKDEELGSIFVWLALALIFFVFNNLILAVLNGKKEILSYVMANIAGSLFVMIVTTVMVIKLGLYGALLALATYQSLSFFVTLWLARKTKWFRLQYFFGRIDMPSAKKLMKFTAMALTSVACVPLCHILIRQYLGDEFGWEAAGYWEAMWRMSAAYLMLVTSTLSVYYLPKLSEISQRHEIKSEIIQGYKLILPVAVILSLSIFVLKDLIIRVLFSSDFAQMEILFKWQLIGDTLKIGSWVLAYLMLAKAKVVLFILSEIVFAASFYLFTILFSGAYGLEGVAIAHAVNYFFYWLVMAYFMLYRGF